MTFKRGAPAGRGREGAGRGTKFQSAIDALHENGTQTLTDIALNQHLDAVKAVQAREAQSSDHEAELGNLHANSA